MGASWKRAWNNLWGSVASGTRSLRNVRGIRASGARIWCLFPHALLGSPSSRGHQQFTVGGRSVTWETRGWNWSREQQTENAEPDGPSRWPAR
eukprot:6319462-Pyramimonas_sp.AAC.1